MDAYAKQMSLPSLEDIYQLAPGSALLPVRNLDQIAGGLNIEGGFPAQQLAKTCGHSNPVLWANLILVLDRPLIDQVVFDRIVKLKVDNNYPLLENAIEEINECHFMVAFYMIISYS